MVSGLILIIAALFLSAVFSGSETGLYSLNQVKLTNRLRNTDARARLLYRLRHPIGRSIIAILIANNLANQLVASQAERGFATLVGPGWSVLLATMVMTPVVLMVSEFLPKQLFRERADTVMDRLALVLVLIRFLLWIPVVLIEGLTRFLQGLIPGRAPALWEPYTSRQNLRSFLQAQQATSPLTESQQQMVDRILALERLDLSYEGVSKPLSSIASFNAEFTVGEAKSRLGPKYYQRYLVHREGRPCGYISAVALVAAAGDETVGDLMTPLPTLTIDLPLHEAIQRMHAAGTDLALVTDQGDRPIRIAFRNDALRVLANLEG